MSSTLKKVNFYLFYDLAKKGKSLQLQGVINKRKQIAEKFVPSSLYKNVLQKN